MESHISLKNDYEVTGLHLDTLVSRPYVRKVLSVHE